MSPRKRLLAMLSALLLGGCGSFEPQDSAPDQHVDHTRVADAVPRAEPHSKYGNPKNYEVQGKRYTILENATGFRQRGVASWYGTKFHGRRTSSGEAYDMYAMTAAHKTLPLPSYVRVTHLDTGRKIVVRVNDRGPFAEGRIIDLSYVAAKKLGIDRQGTGRVAIEVIDPRGKARAIGPSPRPASGQGQLYLQVGAFTDHQNATQLLSRLVDATSENVLINRKTAGNRNVYRVRIGPLASEAQVEQLRGALRPRFNTLGIGEAHIVVE
ncbi:MAG: septal ring lytic transglycosylase RlpA family protein [Gammaproteobacteria bacterium]|nr:septal ring lytic transglycosylase RlpA family protein [Gammaproteobacteria bacterium]